MADRNSEHACTVPTVDQPLRSARFDQLIAETLEYVDRRAGDQTRARMMLAGGCDVAQRVRELADEESSCCSFFRFEVTALDGPTKRMALDVEVPSAHTEVLAALVNRAVAAAARIAGPA